MWLIGVLTARYYDFCTSLQPKLGRYLGGAAWFSFVLPAWFAVGWLSHFFAGVVVLLAAYFGGVMMFAHHNYWKNRD